MTPEAIQQMIDASVTRALAAKDQEIASAIGDALRTYADRPVGEKGSPSLQYGVVESVSDTWAMVTLDGQTDPVPINMLGGLVEGERVAVLLLPPSGNLAIGMVTPNVVPPVTPGGDGLVVGHDSFLDTVGVDIGNGGKLQWVLDTGFGIGIAPNAGLFDLTDPERPVVLADGYLTFDMNVQGDTEDEPNQRIQWALVRGSSGLLLGEQGFPTTAANPESNAITFSFSYPCLAGDQVFVQLQTASGSTRHYSMFGSVKLVESLGEATPAGGGFPVGPEDDGTATHEIAVGSGVLTASSTNDADPTKSGSVVTVGGSTPGAFLRAQDSSSGAAILATVVAGLSQVQFNLDGAPLFQMTPTEFRFNGPDPMQMFIGGPGGCGIGVTVGDPNGIVSANQGSLLLDTTGAPPWYNTDSATAWTQLT